MKTDSQKTTETDPVRDLFVALGRVLGNDLTRKILRFGFNSLELVAKIGEGSRKILDELYRNVKKDEVTEL